MVLPTETLLDSFRCLDRPTLDAVQFSTIRFRIAVAKLSDVCLRLLKNVSVRPVHEGQNVVRDSYEICAKPEVGKPKKRAITTQEQPGEYLATLIASSFIQRNIIEWVPLTDRMLQQLQPVLRTVHVGHLRISNIDFASLSPGVFVETLTSFGSISEELHIVICGRNVQPAHTTDALLIYAADKGTRKVDIPVAPETGYDITDEGILSFLKAPSRGGPKKRKLVICRPRLSPQFLERLLEAHESGLVDSNLVMRLSMVNLPHPDVNGPLRFTATDDGFSFGKGITLIKTKAGHHNLVYEGHEAVHQKMLKAEERRRRYMSLRACQKTS